jgi:hypothetical protein
MSNDKMSNANTVMWHRLSLRLLAWRLRPHFVKATMRVREYAEGLLAVLCGPHLLAHHDASGGVVDQEQWTA